MYTFGEPSGWYRASATVGAYRALLRPKAPALHISDASHGPIRPTLAGDSESGLPVFAHHHGERDGDVLLLLSCALPISED